MKKGKRAMRKNIHTYATSYYIFNGLMPYAYMREMWNGKSTTFYWVRACGMFSLCWCDGGKIKHCSYPKWLIIIDKMDPKLSFHTNPFNGCALKRHAYTEIDNVTHTNTHTLDSKSMSEVQNTCIICLFQMYGNFNFSRTHTNCIHLTLYISFR